MADDELDILAAVVRLREAMRAKGDDPDTCSKIAQLFERLDDYDMSAAWYVRASKAAARLEPDRDYERFEAFRQVYLAQKAVEVAPDYLPGRAELAAACMRTGDNLEAALQRAAIKRGAKVLERDLDGDDVTGSARTRLAEYYQSKGEPESAVDWYLRAARHAESNGHLDAALEALLRAADLRSYHRLRREILRVGLLVAKVR